MTMMVIISLLMVGMAAIAVWIAAIKEIKRYLSIKRKMDKMEADRLATIEWMNAHPIEG